MCAKFIEIMDALMIISVLRMVYGLCNLYDHNFSVINV